MRDPSPRVLTKRQSCIAATAVTRPKELIEYALPVLSGKMISEKPPGSPPHIGDVPSSVVQASQEIERRLDAHALSLVKSLRWRCHAHGTASIFKDVEIAPFTWALDGHTWYSLYGWSKFEKIEWQFEYLDSILKPEEEELNILPPEPLAFELLMEALNLQHDNPRSALVIAVAAAEVGTKACLKFIVAGLVDILDARSSPPIVDLLDRYYPKHSRLRVVPTILEQLRKAVLERNSLVHAGKFTLRRDQLQRRLRAIEDLLRIFDVQMGFEWAQKFIGEKTRADLGLPKLDPP